MHNHSSFHPVTSSAQAHDDNLSVDKVFEDPIHVPENPFWAVFKRFGRDEFIALIINVIGTTVVSLFTVTPLVLSLTGPVIEKIGFFPAHFYEALMVFRTTPQNKRKKLKSYFGAALKEGSVSLAEDVAIHDPLYVLMFMWLTRYSGIPIWLLALTSFLVAIGAVAFLEVLIAEIRYRILQRRLGRIGFGRESFFEARFFIKNSYSPHALMRCLQESFGLRALDELEYRDLYYETGLPCFSGRTARVRLRKRTLSPIDNVRVGASEWIALKKENSLQSVQVVYTRANEERQNRLDQFRFFPIQKDKFYFLLAQKMPSAPEEIQDEDARKAMRVGKFLKEIVFRRTILVGKEIDLLIAVDQDFGNKGFYLIEVKSRKDVLALTSAMRFVMMEFPVVQTTVGKSDLL